MERLRDDLVRRTLLVVLVLNAAVAAAKILAGWVSGLLAVQGDGFHSSIDALNNVVGLVAIRYAVAPPDHDHPYGHGKIETLAALGVAGFIALTAFELLRAAIQRLLDGAMSTAFNQPLVPAVMLITLVVNVAVATYEQRQGTRLQSAFLLADAAHTSSDVLVTCAVLASWVCTVLGYPMADALTSLFVVAMIGRIGYQVFARTVPVLIDADRIPLDHLRTTILSVPGVVVCDRLRSRGEGSSAYVECRILVREPENGIRAHEVTEEIERRLALGFDIPSDHVTVHVEAIGSIPDE